MIRAGILIVLVAAIAIGLSGAQEECKESINEGPHVGSRVSQYSVDTLIEPESSIVSENVTIFMNTFHESADPSDIIVLNADKSIEVDDMVVKKIPRSRSVINARSSRSGLRPFKGRLDSSGVAIESICRDSSRQLLVIKLGEKLESHWKIEVKFSAKVPLREDGKGLHKLEDGSIRANFAGSQAHLIMPCIDDSNTKPSHFVFELTTEYRLKSTCAQFERDGNNGKNGKTLLETIDPTNIESIWFELKP